MQVSVGIKGFLYSVLLLFSSFLVWIFFAKMDDVVKSTATLRPIDNISEVRSLFSGEILEKNYSQNQKVVKGDLLLRLDCSSEEMELAIIENQKIHYENEILINEKLYYIIENDVVDVDEESFIKASSFLSEYNLIQLKLQDLNEKYNYEISKPISLRVEQNIQDCKNEIEQIKLELRLWKTNKKIEIKELINSYEEKIQSINSRIASLERIIKNAHLYAPIDGYIDENLELNVGDYLVGGNEVLRIIPNRNDNLKAELIIDAASVALIKEGQEVILRFPGLQSTNSGKLKANITSIPADISVLSNIPVFIVEAKLVEPYLYSSSGEKIKLQAGLTAEATIIVARDKIIKMLLKKLNFIN